MANSFIRQCIIVAVTHSSMHLAIHYSDVCENGTESFLYTLSQEILLLVNGVLHVLYKKTGQLQAKLQNDIHVYTGMTI